MLTENLFQKVLLDPARKGADTLYIVSGYARAGMAHQHIQTVQKKLKSDSPPIHVNLIVGMAAKDGVANSSHLGFVSLSEETLKGAFTCGYLMKPPQVHAKVYAWFRGDKPTVGYIGSANYTRQGFLEKNQREVMTLGDPNMIRDYYRSIEAESCLCTHQDAQRLVRGDELSVFTGEDASVAPSLDSSVAFPPSEGKITISFLNRYGDLPQRSGLNWGQRPEEKRAPNQAYIRIPAAIYRSDFFPTAKNHFTMHTDDGQVIICARRQQHEKAIHSTENNSIMGEYFRRRLGVGLGQPVSKADLEKYGRTDVDFYKIDDDNYYMDFSV